MALVSTGFVLEVSLVDYGNNTTSKTYQMTAADYDTAITDVAIVMPALINMTDAVIASYSVKEVYQQDALALPSVVNPVSVKASMTAYINDAGSKKGDFDVPSPRIGIFQTAVGSGADIVDGSDAAVIAYYELFQTGGQLLFSDGEVMGGFIGGVRTSQTRRLARN